jgi:hyperosmotically inducible protein
MLRKLTVLLFTVALVTVVSACSQTDSGVTASVKSKLAADDMVKARQIDVTTANHAVALTGTVDTAAEKARALEIARNTKGVKSVIDNLTVGEPTAPTSGTDVPPPASDVPRAPADEQSTAAKTKDKTKEIAKDTGDAVSDASITAAVKTKLLGDTSTPGLKIDVDTSNGVVTLSGDVPTAAERTKAVKIARETKGVKKVVDKITVAKKS